MKVISELLGLLIMTKKVSQSAFGTVTVGVTKINLCLKADCLNYSTLASAASPITCAS